MISAAIAMRKGIERGLFQSIYQSKYVLQKSRKLNKDEVVLRLGDGKAVAAEAVGIINLVISDRVRQELKDCYSVPSMIKNIISIWLLVNAGFEFLVNKNCFYLMKDGSSHLLGKLNNGLYILQRMKRLVDSKSLEIDNLDNLPAYRGGEYVSGEFIDYLKKNDIVSQWTPPGVPQLAERNNRTLPDMILSMMSFTELPLSFWGYALETATRLLNIAQSKTVPQTPYQIWHNKSTSYKYLKVWVSPAYIKRLVGDKLHSRSSLCKFIDYPKETAGYYFYDPLSRRSARVPQPPERYGFLGVTGQLDNDPKTYREAISDIDSEKWLEVMKSKMDSMSSNEVWMLVDTPKGGKPVGWKWVYKHKIGADGEVTTFKARLVAKGYTQRPGDDFEETFSPVAMAKSIRIMIATTACTKSPHPLSGGVLVFRGSPDRDVGSRRSMEPTLEAELENNNVRNSGLPDPLQFQLRILKEGGKFNKVRCQGPAVLVAAVIVTMSFWSCPVLKNAWDLFLAGEGKVGIEPPYLLQKLPSPELVRGPSFEGCMGLRKGEGWCGNVAAKTCWSPKRSSCFVVWHWFEEGIGCGWESCLLRWLLVALWIAQRL
ncbi:Retrovirus-related Pol polyprotein from transposon RE1 [Sesamum angolense]|uniref:Retrovirus-related Pol polyprotein from transposon RE1 n=1 Tax=Sesamum angolense TaxID=2727404 RepID=A0AAE1W3L4_9LAMI|nr:Retrovirus-related Pol polyprotein from transposon RE1 [Sesamum angolense]